MDREFHGGQLATTQQYANPSVTEQISCGNARQSPLIQPLPPSPLISLLRLSKLLLLKQYLGNLLITAILDDGLNGNKDRDKEEDLQLKVQAQLW